MITCGNFTKTTAGVDSWKSLTNSAELQDNCNQEGFNIEKKNKYDVNGYMNLRIGLVTNNQNNCLSCDTCVGFGISVQGCDADLRNTTCGHMAICGKFNNKDISGFGYIFVQ